MKKSNLLSALAIAAVAAASLSLPATASAASFKHQETQMVRSDHSRDGHIQKVHNVERRYNKSQRHGHTKWAPSYPRHSRGQHYERHHRHGKHYDYRPVERHPQRRHNDDFRVRIFYDLHL